MPLWKEFAIEPDLFANFNLGSEILSGIGVEHGRIIGALPKKWAQRVRDVGRQHNKERQQLKLIERLNQLKATIVPRDFAFDGNRPWQDQAFEAHVQKPFHALLLNGTNTNVASIDATLGLLGVPPWESDRKLVVPRNSQNLVSALHFLLGQARDISIVDSYFDPSLQLRDSRWLKPIQAIAKALPTDGRLNRFEIHACNSWDPKRRWQPGIFVRHCRNNLSAALPKGIKVKALLWQERKDGPEFHERLIVTDLGGIVIDPGVDEGPAGKMYTLRLMGNTEIQEYFTKFTPTSAPYDLIDEVDITGT